jgi:hypothetical protein
MRTANTMTSTNGVSIGRKHVDFRLDEDGSTS